MTHSLNVTSSFPGTSFGARLVFGGNFAAR
jgi:hypothetical protein